MSELSQLQDIRETRVSATAAWPLAETRPEDVFLAWLLRLPAGVDVAAAAAAEIMLLDRAAPLSPGLSRLRQLMSDACALPTPTVRLNRRRIAARH